MKKLLLNFSLLLIVFGLKAQNCSDLFISEYVEGTGNNKAFEIYNPSPNSIDLSNYRIVRYSNGSQIGADSLVLAGILASGDAWVVVNGQTTGTTSSPACDPALQALADQLDGVYPAPTYMNGNDAMVLVKISPYAKLDIFGKIGEDPGTSWTDVFPYTDAQGAYWTKDHTLQRKSSVKQGVAANPSAFNVTTEWDSLPKNTWVGLGTHSCSCPLGVWEYALNVKMSIFPNPVYNDFFAINASENIEQVQIVNSVGQIIKTVKNSNKQKELSVSTVGLSKGFYFVNVKFSEGLLSNKISIQ